MEDEMKTQLIATFGPEMAEEIANPPTCSTGMSEVNVTLSLIPDTDGTVHYHCNLCGANFTRTPIQMTLGSFSFYAHYKPGREPAQVPDAFLKAFEG